MKTMDNITKFTNITKIESLDFETAKSIASEIIKIKNHDCCFIKFDPPFGYSAIVFANNRQISYANDYQLHWQSKAPEELHDLFIQNLNDKLYTDEELMSPITTYDEYRLKNNYLRNYDIQKYDHMSIFHIDKPGDDKAKAEYNKQLKKYPYLNSVSFCYVKDEAIIARQIKILEFLNKEYKKLKDNNDTFRDMIKYELANHEACITGDYTDTLMSMGLKFEKLTPEQQQIVKTELHKQIEEYGY